MMENCTSYLKTEISVMVDGYPPRLVPSPAWQFIYNIENYKLSFFLFSTIPLYLSNLHVLFSLLVTQFSSVYCFAINGVQI